jgi:hypothetical protein
VALAIQDIRSSLPFPLTGGHYDNGMECINKPLLAWCLERHSKATRSRPYRKNDNCFAEQKNYDAVRKTVGYFRFDTEAEQEALAEGLPAPVSAVQLLVSVIQAGGQGETGGRAVQEGAGDAVPKAA